jgi:carbonic anhydrase
MRSSFHPILLIAVCYLLQLVDSQEQEREYCSPIILPGYQYIDLPDQPVLMSYGFSGDPTIVTIQDALRFGPFKTAGSVEWSGIEAELTYFQLKLPAEHHLGPLVFPLELQMKHKTAAGKFVIVSLLFQEGDDNSVLRDLFYYIGKSSSENFLLTHGVNLDRFVRSLGETTSTDPWTISCTRYLHYNGSLTGDDEDGISCDGETVWLVLRDPLTVSAGQLASIKAVSGVQENAASFELIAGRDVLGGNLTERDYDEPLLAPVLEDSEVEEEEKEESTSSVSVNPVDECGFFDYACQPYWQFILIGLAALPILAIPVCCFLWCNRCMKNRELTYAQALQPGQPFPHHTGQFMQDTQAPVTYKRQVWDGEQQRMRTEVPGMDRIRCDSTGYCWIVGSNPNVKGGDEVESSAFLPAR